jgi:hypothetical protein
LQHERGDQRHGAGTAGHPAEGRTEDDYHASREQSVQAVTTRADPALVKALARAFRYQRLLDDGRYASISEMADAERIERGYLGSLSRLALLAPDIVEAILNRQAPSDLGLPRLLEPLPLSWMEQRFMLNGGGTA